MNRQINDEFLTKNLFEKDKIGCGYFPWRYEDKDASICISPWCEGGKCFIFGENRNTKESIHLERPTMYRLTRNDLKRVVDFLGIKLDFDYE